MLICGHLFHHFWEAMNPFSNLDIQMIMFVKSYDVGGEGTIEASLFQMTHNTFLFILMVLSEQHYTFYK